MTPRVAKQLAHELDVIERCGLAEFFLINWDIVRFCRDHQIPAQGRGSAADSIVAYVLDITKVDPIAHDLHVPTSWFFAAFSAALLVAALQQPEGRL